MQNTVAQGSWGRFGAGLPDEATEGLLVAKDADAGWARVKMAFHFDNLDGVELAVEILIESVGGLATVHGFAAWGTARAYSSS